MICLKQETMEYLHFFSEKMSAQEVVNSINQAYNNRQFVQGTRNTYIGYDSNGMEIKMFIDMSTGEIISAFPVY